MLLIFGAFLKREVIAQHNCSCIWVWILQNYGFKIWNCGIKLCIKRMVGPTQGLMIQIQLATCIIYLYNQLYKFKCKIEMKYIFKYQRCVCSEWSGCSIIVREMINFQLWNNRYSFITIDWIRTFSYFLFFTFYCYVMFTQNSHFLI